MKYVIFYEHAERELQNAYLLKSELNKRGHDVYIYDIYYLIRTGQVLDFEPSAIIVPFLYNDSDVALFKSRFKANIKNIVNLQYEQIYSQRWEEAGFHNPKGLAMEAIHLCWGNISKKRLISNGIKEENAVVVGSLNVDMDMIKFESIYKNKIELSQRFNIPVDNKWILFISSFSVTDLNMANINGLNGKFGEVNTKEFVDISYKSKEMILQWLKQYAKQQDAEIIYRPHPAEKKDKCLNEIEFELKNFHVISQDSVRTWIKNCDYINTWISTSIIDAYFMNKNCSVLRPIELPKDMDIKIYSNAKFLITYEEFYKYNNMIKEIKFPINKDEIIQYYDIDKNLYAYERICDLLEKISR